MDFGLEPRGRHNFRAFSHFLFRVPTQGRRKTKRTAFAATKRGRQISASSACPSVPRAFATARRRGSCIIRRLLTDFGKKAPFFVESSFDPLSASNVANVTSDHRSCLCVINIAGSFEKVNNTGLLRSTVQCSTHTPHHRRGRSSPLRGPWAKALRCNLKL